MATSFDIVDRKLAEADFFCDHLAEAGFDVFAAECYFNAFVASSRTVTLALQRSMNGVPGFEEWYRQRQETMRADPLARFFNDARNAIVKRAEHPFSGGSMRSKDGKPSISHVIGEIGDAPDRDALSAARAHLCRLVELVFDCYRDFATAVDPQAHYTRAHFASTGRTVEDAEAEIIGVRGWTDVPGFPEEERWKALRRHVGGCGVDHLFETHLGRQRAPVAPDAT
jgi:hypothetical protein